MSKKIGVLGMGRMGERIVTAAEELGHQVVRVYDSFPDAYAFRNEALKAVAAPDMESFWATDLDLVAVATHGPSHCPLVMEGIDRGHRRFMIEKPLCTSMEEGEALQAKAAASGARVVVNHGRRYCTPYDALTALDGSEEMGPLAAGVLTMGAAGLGCMGTHFFDLFNRVFGRATDVFAHVTQTTVPNPRGAQFDDPGGTAIVRYGARRAIIEMSDDIGVPTRMEFVYERGRVVIENELTPWRVMAREAKDRDAPVSRYGLPLVERTLEPFRPCDIIFATASAVEDALGDGPNISGIEEGLRAFEVFAGIRWSGATGELVRFPLPESARKEIYSIS